MMMRNVLRLWNSHRFRIGCSHSTMTNDERIRRRSSVVTTIDAPTTDAVQQRSGNLEFEPQLQCDHSWAAVTTQSHPQQASWRRSGIGQCSEASLRRRLAGNASQHDARKTEVRMVEDIEELCIQTHLHVFSHREPFRQIKVVPHEAGTPQGIATEISELAILRVVAAVAGSGTRIDCRDKRIGVEPLDRTGLRNARKCMMLVERHAGYDVRELRTAALHDPSTIRGVGRAQH